jgi:gliding motility-associated-like protein
MKNFSKLILASFLVFFSISTLEAQCSLTTTSADQTITCGDCVTLSAFGSGNGAVAFQENFNSGSPVGWGFTQAVTIANNTCGVPSPDGTPFMWMGNASVNPRDMTTVSLNVAIGGTICFQMRYSIQGDASPCEGPDEPGEGVHLQYSTNGGTTWVDIQYYQPDPVNGSPTVAWNTYCANIPAAAMTSATKFRWHQDAVSGADYDHWGIDNVSITLNDPTYQIKWLYGPQYAYPVGNGGGANPTPVCPLTTTTYNAQISNGTITCNSSITITVVNPTIVITAPNDTSICPGTCIPLPTQAYELVSPASTPTISNFQPNVSIVTPQLLPCVSFGGCTCANGTTVGLGGTCPGVVNASANLTIAGLNGNNLGSSAPTNGTAQITSVCIPSVTILGGCPGLTLANVSIVLQHPNGTQVTLASVGSLTGSTILNMCFQLGAAAISTGSGSNYNGTYNPQNSWASLNGLVSEGIWVLKLLGVNNQACITTVNLTGWNMTFNDPKLTTPVNFTWSPNSPSTLITGATTLTPTVCPPLGATTFTITATDLAGCTSVSEPVVVTSAVCCPLVISDTNRVNPTCGASNGTITVLTTGAGAGLEFSKDGGVTWIPATGSNGIFTGLPAGNYTIQVRDVTCTKTITNVVLSNSVAVPTFVATPTQPTCTVTGSILVTPTGASPFTYSISGGAFTAGTTATTTTFGSLAAGSYPIQVKDVNGCVSTINSTTLTASGGPTIITVTATQSTCGLANGTIFVSASGTGPLTFSKDGGVTFSPPGSATTITYSSLAAGTYALQVKDGNGCIVSQSQIITTTALPTITSTTPTQPACGTANGSIAVVASGAPTLQFSINGAAYVNGTTATTLTYGSLNSGTYTILVKDGNGCISLQDIETLTAPGAPNLTTVVVQPTCGSANGSINATATGTGPFTFSFDGGATTTGTTATTLNTPTLSGRATDYVIIVTDAAGCTFSIATTLNIAVAPTFTAVPTQPICSGTGSILVTPTGIGPFTYSDDNAATFVSGSTLTIHTFVSLAPATFSIQVKDANGCSATATQSIVIIAPTLPTITSTTPTQATCGSSNGTIAVVATGTGPLTFSIDGGTTYVAGTTATTHTFTNLAAGGFTIKVKDGNGCIVSSTLTNVTNAGGPTFVAVATQPTCGGTGSILVTPTGTAPFTYSNASPTVFVAGSTATTHTFATLASGTYPIIVKDANGCISAVSNIVINASSRPVITVPTVVNAKCGLANGAINAITVTGGVGPYSFSIDGGTTTQAANTFSSLLGAIPAQVYTINVTDALGCIAVAVNASILTTNNPVINAGPDQTVCVGLPVTLSGSGATTLVWSPVIQNNVAFLASATTTYTLTGTDALGCIGTDVVTITVNSNPPPTAVFGNNRGCSPLAVNMTNATGNNCVWNFGDGTPVAIGCTQTHIYPDAGVYTVTLSSAGANGCVSSNTFTDTIHVFGHPEASFATTPKELIATDPAFTTINTSSGAIAYQWYFGDGTFSNVTQPIHNYLNSDSTSFIIRLVATNAEGCTDTSYNNVIIYEDLIYYIPNSFTPDGNAFNQTFQPVFYSGFDPYNFRMIIFDRWGEIIFETKDANVGWDGSYLNQELVQSGVYTWKIEFKTNRNDERKRVYGHVNVLR